MDIRAANARRNPEFRLFEDGAAAMTRRVRALRSARLENRPCPAR